jgi:hypothetical protein
MAWISSGCGIGVAVGCGVSVGVWVGGSVGRGVTVDVGGDAGVVREATGLDPHADRMSETRTSDEIQINILFILRSSG